MLNPTNAIHIKNFFSDATDTELYDLIPFLTLLNNVKKKKYKIINTYSKFKIFIYITKSSSKM